jgi:Flp pilus assembly protein CpaB
MSTLAFKARQTGVRWGMTLALVAVPAIVFAVLAWKMSAGGTRALVAARAVPAGQVITAADVRLTSVKGEGIATLSDVSEVVGKRVAGPLVPGAVLSASSVAKGSLAQGEAGLALTLDPDQAVSGLVRPGEQVLVVGQVRDPAGTTTPVQIAARAIDVAPAPGGEREARVVVTLAVRTPAEAAVVAAAEQAGRVRLVVLGN